MLRGILLIPSLKSNDLDINNGSDAEGLPVSQTASRSRSRVERASVNTLSRSLDSRTTKGHILKDKNCFKVSLKTQIPCLDRLILGQLRVII